MSNSEKVRRHNIFLIEAANLFLVFFFKKNSNEFYLHFLMKNSPISKIIQEIAEIGPIMI